MKVLYAETSHGRVHELKSFEMSLVKCQIGYWVKWCVRGLILLLIALFMSGIAYAEETTKILDAVIYYTEEDIWQDFEEALHSELNREDFTVISLQNEDNAEDRSEFITDVDNPPDKVINSWIRIRETGFTEGDWSADGAMRRFSESFVWVLNISDQLQQYVSYVPIDKNKLPDITNNSNGISLFGLVSCYLHSTSQNGTCKWEIMPFFFLDGTTLYENATYLYIRKIETVEGYEKRETEWVVTDQSRVYNLMKWYNQQPEIMEKQNIEAWLSVYEEEAITADNQEKIFKDVSIAEKMKKQAENWKTDERTNDTEDINEIETDVEFGEALQTTTEDMKRLSDMFSVGDVYIFGKYEQDNSTSNGQEQIEWIILDKNDEGILLFSKYILDCIPYNQTRTKVSWENCSLRSWMNEDFLDTAFNEDERAGILAVLLDNPDNPQYGTSGCESTLDCVFALSIDEAKKYLNDLNRNTTATEYARNRGAKLRNELPSKQVYWWLRTPGDSSVRAMVTLLRKNDFDYQGNGVGAKFDGGGRNNTGVRPALWLGWDYIAMQYKKVMVSAGAEDP